MATTNTTDNDTKTLKRIAKLFETLVEVETKAAEVRDEIGKLLRGEPAMGDLLKEALAYFATSWEIRYRSKYAWRNTIDVPQMKRLLKLLGLAELKTRVSSYLASNDDFFKRARHSFGMFVSTVNQHAGQGVDADDELELAAAPADCRHKPSCRTDIEHTSRLMEDRRGALS
ncbi:MAG: hypothetical protein ACYC2H_01530 [Thermoplasmatota archaeon]